MPRSHAVSSMSKYSQLVFVGCSYACTMNTMTHYITSVAASEDGVDELISSCVLDDSADRIEYLDKSKHRMVSVSPLNAAPYAAQRCTNTATTPSGFEYRPQG